MQSIHIVALLLHFTDDARRWVWHAIMTSSVKMLTQINNRVSSVLSYDQLWTNEITTCTIVYPVHWMDPQISFFRLSFCLSVCVCEQLVLERLRSHSLPILEMCGFWFRQFSGSADHICQQISSKWHVQIKFVNPDFVFNGEWNRK